MSFEKLERLAQLQQTRDEAERVIVGVDAEIRRVLGEGFVIPGIAKVKPIKKYGPKSKTQVSTVQVNGVPFDISAQVTQITKEPPEKTLSENDAKKVSETVEALINGGSRKSWTVPDICGATKLTKTQVSNSVYWLQRQNKITRLATGLFGQKKAS